MDALLARFGLADAAGQVARTYSGGMQRKLDIAMGLIHRPRVLFMDEPTTGLDPEARADLWEEIARLSRQDAITVLLTTHYLEEADRLADRLAIVDRGRIVAEGEPETLKGELFGDAVQVEFDGTVPESLVRTALTSLTGLREVLVDPAPRARARRSRRHGSACRCSPPWRPAASRSPPSASRGRRSMTCTSGMRDDPSVKPIREDAR